jgi:hypothetical protein
MHLPRALSAFVVVALVSACGHRDEAPKPSVQPLRSSSPVLDRLRKLHVEIDPAARLAPVGSGLAFAAGGAGGFHPLVRPFFATVPAKTSDAVHLALREGESESFALDVVAEDVSEGAAKTGVV